MPWTIGVLLANQPLSFTLILIYANIIPERD